MKNTYRRLAFLIAKGIIKPDDWYNITIRHGEIDLQGCYNTRLAHELATEYKISMAISDSGYVQGQKRVGRCNINITLT
jgi:hypothetical protein